MKNTDWKSVKERTDEYDKANTWEHLDKFDNSHECESEEYYKLYCTQNGVYMSGNTLKTLTEWRDYLIELHSYDTDESNLINLTLFELCNYYEWEIHDANEKFVDIQKNNKTKENK
ncbi:hypothetical protein [Hyphomonas sp.]|jgi:hypothetical protein|uniref:hypothetical protein n=1 Tax=Hyphomonas sp. TaxID=87 RepID=UPI000C98B4B7|nr:hypothetical protein [Hyphomonas sp.]MAL46792.1 hypothetical protein [Hyphomonas sp.]|tara:strand:- start:66 stop:413 length:348 start_codon:yes stop_codon:yes gene_type:complete